MSGAEALNFIELEGDRHRHGDGTVHAYPHDGPHAHGAEPHGAGGAAA